MILKQRSTGWRATCVAGGLVFLVAMNPASGGIISDRSAFVGDFTVIDFETLADGTPLILDEGEIFGMFPQEYAAFGVTITSSGNDFGNDWPFISNARNAAFDRAHELAGSLHNVVSPGTNSDAYLRIDFLTPTNAVGLAAINRTDGPIVRLDTFNDRGELLESAFLTGALVDGTVRGEDFGSEFDIEFGFIGIFAPESEIAYATVSTRITQLDDLHFGIIPEPSSGCILCCALLLIGVGRRRFRALRGKLSALLVPVVILSAPIALRAETIIGTVTGYVMTSEDPICGDNGPNAPEDWCVQQPLQEVPLHGVRICKSGSQVCTFTDAQGDYEILISDRVPVKIAPDLAGPGMTVPGDSCPNNTKRAEL